MKYTKEDAKKRALNCATINIKKINGNLKNSNFPAAFERCADVITSLILKYGPALKRKWNLICMMNMKSVPV